MQKEVQQNLSHEWRKYFWALVLGAMVWAVFKIISPSQDPEDQKYYWQIGYPISILLAGMLGILFPERPWRWGLIIIWIQFIMGLITTKSDLNLLPPGVLFYAFLSIPCVISAHISARLRQKIRKKKDDSAKEKKVT